MSSLGPETFEGMDERPRSEGGTGKSKPKRNKPSPARIAEVREKKVLTCRVCDNVEGLELHAHHIVRAGSPHFGSFTEHNILGLCAKCHQAIHSGDDKTRKVFRFKLTRDEIQYSDDKAYKGFVDDVYWPLPKVGVKELTAAAADLARPKAAPKRKKSGGVG